ncbi:hypothetical protein [Streptomyces hokutonensis]|uniref:hypothetical protein n=1 Tax=Streptomyces hokutonensis TaxID=1306990 RepID=UPI0038153FE4
MSVADLVNREFTWQARDQLWVTDITEHSTLEDKVYCDRRLTHHALATNALSMAISNRRPQPGGTVIHPNHRVQPRPAPGRSLNGLAPPARCPPWAQSETA